MNDGIEKKEVGFSDEELKRIGKSVQEIDEAIGDAIIDINKPVKQNSGLWNTIMAFYIIIKSNQVGVETQNMMRVLNLQVQELDKFNVQKELGFDAE